MLKPQRVCSFAAAAVVVYDDDDDDDDDDDVMMMMMWTSAGLGKVSERIYKLQLQRT
jgi:hypothetical protein